MALRAGYYGIKKSVLAAISNLSGAKIIKSIGDGLKLTSAGKLSCDIDTNTMEFKAGKLSAKGGFTKDLLYGNEIIAHPPTQNSSIQLAEAFTDYDFILVVGGFTSSGVKVIENWLVDATEITSLETAINNSNGKIYVFPFNTGVSGGGQWVRMGQDPEDATHKTLTFVFNGEVGIYKIYGIKL